MRINSHERLQTHLHTDSTPSARLQPSRNPADPGSSLKPSRAKPSRAGSAQFQDRTEPFPFQSCRLIRVPRYFKLKRLGKAHGVYVPLLGYFCVLPRAFASALPMGVLGGASVGKVSFCGGSFTMNQPPGRCMYQQKSNNRTSPFSTILSVRLFDI